MYIFEILKISLASIRANKVRAVLTTLGIIIGISAVIAMLSIGQGAQSVILEQVQGLGANTISIYPIANFGGSFSQTSFSRLTTSRLDREILEILGNQVKFPEITGIAPEISGSQEITYRSNVEFSSVYGVNADYFSVRDVAIAQGRTLSAKDNDELAKVAFLGARIATKLFGESDAIGKTIRIAGNGYTVVGVGAAKNASYDDRIVIPLNTAGIVLFGDRDYSLITVEIQDEKLIDSVATKIEEELRDYYRTSKSKDPPFTVFTSKEFLELAATITGVFTTLLASIAGISLVVGGIGIMNIMLVSVTERTREIGLRKAIGAKRSAILAQFLMEAVVLTLIGGLVGIALGVGFGLLISKIGNFPAVVSLQAIFLATSVSAGIGVIFGFYPAYQASRLNPIEALRYE